MLRLDESKSSTKSQPLNCLSRSSINSFKIWNKSELVIDMFDRDEAMIGRSSLKDDIQVNDVMVAEGVKAVAGKVRVGDTMHVERVALDVQIVDVEHQNKRKGICSLLNWMIHEQHGRPHQALPRSR
tara:strand:- start:89 stop:469 length:381 start_codon:yes stop_codon:yes gene_type:complete